MCELVSEQKVLSYGLSPGIEDVTCNMQTCMNIYNSSCLRYTPIILFAEGNLVAAQIAVGQIAEFNMWDYLKTEEEFIDGTKTTGNIVNWDTLNTNGDVIHTQMDITRYISSGGGT